jgi:hypothetical protein
MPCVDLAVQARAFTHAGNSVDRERRRVLIETRWPGRQGEVECVF